ncbi:MAG: MFS transporter [Bacilli bacterium]|nr:MFS transporter [Bacilli bacterium]
MNISKILQKRSFTGNAPKSTLALYFLAAVFYDGIFEFFTLFVLLYVQQVSPIIREAPEIYSQMFFAVTLGLILIKVGCAFSWTFMGHFMESRSYRYGKYRTFFFLGTILTTFFFSLMFFVAPLASGWLYVSLFLLFFLLMEVSYSMNDVAFWAFLNTLSSNEEKKGQYSAALNFCAVIGTYIVASLAPAVGNSLFAMKLLGLLMIVSFSVTMIIFTIGMHEPVNEPVSEEARKSSLFEPFRILFGDRQIFLIMACMLLIFIAQDCFIGNSANYFYYMYGYGPFSGTGVKSSHTGSFVSFFFTVSFGIGQVLAEPLYPLLRKKLNKKQIIISSSFVLAALYSFLFFYCLVPGEPNEWALYVTTMLLSITHGQLFMTLFMNSMNASVYYQAKTGQNRNTSIQSVRSFSAMNANAIQTGIFYLTLIFGGLRKTDSQIAEIQAQVITQSYGPFGNPFAEMNQVIASADVGSGLLFFRSTLTLLPLALSLIAASIALFHIPLTSEKEYEKMVTAVEEGKK